MSRWLRLYIVAVATVGVLATVLSTLLAPPSVERAAALLAVLIVALIALTYLAPVKVAPNRSVVLDTAPAVVAILALPVTLAAPVCAFGVALGNLLLRRPWFNVLFNAAQQMLSVLAAGVVYRILAPASLVSSGRDLNSVLALLPAGVVLYVVSAFAVDVAAALQRHRSPFEHWLAVHAESFLPHTAQVGIGGATAVAASDRPWLLLIALMPIVAVYAVFRTSLRSDAALVSLAEAMADSMEASVPRGTGCLRRTAALAREVALAHGMSRLDADRTYLAGLLKDADRMLAPKPAREDIAAGDRCAAFRGRAATAAEWVGSHLGLPAVAQVIRFQYECFDGQGSPFGLAGMEIPRESRILAVCATWITLRSGSGARPALSDAQALMVLHAGAGLQWDPAVVQTVSGMGEAARSGRPEIEPLVTRGGAALDMQHLA